jgi:hypothetical protein
MKQAGQEIEAGTASETPGVTPWAWDDLDLPEMKRPWSADIDEPTLKLSGRVGGLVPVQGEGLLDSKPWYFRARYEHWTFTMAEPGGDVHAVRSMFHAAALEDGWNLERDWPFGQFSAGYMPLKASLANIRACARMYWAGKLPRVAADLEKYAEEEKMLDEWSLNIRVASYCECNHNQPQHGIGKKLEVVSDEPLSGDEEVAGPPVPGARRRCLVCGCEDFRYSSEKSALHRLVGEGEQPDDSTIVS